MEIFNTYKKTLVFIISLVIAIIFIEGLGYIYRTKMKEDRVISIIPDELLNHKLAPNIRYVDRVRDIPNVVYTNDQSWPEHENIALEKPSNTYRIFYVGDSTTHTVVNEGKRMPDIVENELNKIYTKTGKKIEVINAGTSSYSTIIYYLLIKNKILQYKPDLVVINEDMSDVRDDAAYKLSTDFDRNGLPIAAHPSDPKLQGVYHLTPQGLVKIPLRQRINAYMVAHSVIIGWTEKLMLTTIEKLAPQIYKKKIFDPLALNDPNNWLQLTWDETTQNNIDFSMNMLSETIKLLRAHNVKVMITGAPHYPQYTGQWSAKPHAVLAETAKKLNAPYLNSYEALRGQVTNTDVAQYYWSNDPVHFNEPGNAIWAKAQLNFLREPKNRLLP